MAVDERARHALHEAARRALGVDEAVTLMEYLPPVGWADVATKRDLDQLFDRLTAVIHQVENRMLRWTVSAVFSGVALAFVAARFA